MKILVILLIGVCILDDRINAQSYRLPSNVIPEQYYLEILSHLGTNENFNFDGKVTIQVKCVRSAKNITLHSKDLDIQETDVKVKDVSATEKDLGIAGIERDKDNDFLIIQLSDSLVEDHKYKIYIPFKGKMNDGLAGFYRSSYTGKGKKKWLGVTQFEAISARRAFPCFDEPAMKAKFEIIIGRHKDYSSISNMPLVKTEPIKEKEGWFWDQFENSVPMSTYLVAYIVSDFGFRTAEPSKTNVTFNIWARKDALNQVEFAKKVGPLCLDFFEDYFDVKYPLPKQDMVAVPDFSAGAMENWGLITYREAYLLFDPDVSSSTSRHSVMSVIAHELAHQWFGNLVTMKWWTDLWLNEGFATYMSAIATDRIFPKWNSLSEETATNLLGVFNFDGLKSSHPVSVPIGHPDQIDEIFDTISYKKGSFLIRMMSLFLGEDNLRRGVSDYLKKHKYGNAEQDDLWEALTHRAHESGILPSELTVKTVMDTWTLQTGYPMVTITRNYDSKTAEVEQKRFLRDADQLKAEKRSCWWIPLSYTTEKESNFNRTTPKHWISCSDEIITIENTGGCDEWMIANIQAAGLVRVKYDDKNWRLIARKLQSESYKDISVLNRVQILEDSSDLANVGELSFDIFFDLLQYLKYEENYVPWKAALGNVGFLKKQLRLSPSYGNFKKYMNQILTTVYQRIGGFTPGKSNPDKLDAVKHKSLITSWSCIFEVENCVEDAVELFHDWMKNPEENPIPKDLRSIVYCNSIKHGGEKEWEFLWKQYHKSNVASDMNIMLPSLGCSRESWLLERYLARSLDDTSGIRRQDISTVFSSVVSSEVGFYVAKEWFYENFKRIQKYLSPNTRRISRYLSSLSNRIITKKDQEDFQKFVDDHRDILKEVKQGVEQSLETIKVNLQWQEKHKGSIDKIIERHIHVQN